jgi:hypothetical protein
MTTNERIKVLSEAKPDSWIAFSSDESRVLAFGDSYAEAVKGAEAKGEENPVIVKTPENWSPRVFSTQP